MSIHGSIEGKWNEFSTISPFILSKGDCACSKIHPYDHELHLVHLPPIRRHISFHYLFNSYPLPHPASLL